jgi:hypothetical protein
MKLLIKLALVAVIANGAYHIGDAYLTHYRFRDSVEEMIKFRGNKDDAWVHDQIVVLAQQYDVPVDPKAIDINGERLHTKITVGYVRSIELFPGVKREWPFMMNIDTLPDVR